MNLLIRLTYLLKVEVEKKLYLDEKKNLLIQFMRPDLQIYCPIKCSYSLIVEIYG